MKAQANIIAICAAAAAAMTTPTLAASASCNDQHATCLQRGGSEDRCLMVWHQCKVALAKAPVRTGAKLVAVSNRR